VTKREALVLVNGISAKANRVRTMVYDNWDNISTDTEFVQALADIRSMTKALENNAA
jgi:hypothetical protein